MSIIPPIQQIRDKLIDVNSKIDNGTRVFLCLWGNGKWYIWTDEEINRMTMPTYCSFVKIPGDNKEFDAYALAAELIRIISIQGAS